MIVSAFYFGKVMHQRLRPKPHRLRYRLAQILIDIDELDSLSRQLKFFSRNRFNLISFYDCDYGNDSGKGLRNQIERMLRTAGIRCDGGPIRLLTMPRMLGHVFNPISTWLCYSPAGQLRATIYEVTNTFNDRHFYVIPVAPDTGSVIRQSCAKALYVSPFMDMDMTYRFALRSPEKRVSLSVTASDLEGDLIVANFVGQHQSITDSAILRLVVALPLMTILAVAAIHWEAMKLWFKGIGVRRHPAPPVVNVTVGQQS